MRIIAGRARAPLVGHVSQHAVVLPRRRRRPCLRARVGVTSAPGVAVFTSDAPTTRDRRRQTRAVWSTLAAAAGAAARPCAPQRRSTTTAAAALHDGVIECGAVSRADARASARKRGPPRFSTRGELGRRATSAYSSSAGGCAILGGGRVNAVRRPAHRRRVVRPRRSASSERSARRVAARRRSIAPTATAPRWWWWWPWAAIRWWWRAPAPRAHRAAWVWHRASPAPRARARQKIAPRDTSCAQCPRTSRSRANRRRGRRQIWPLPPPSGGRGLASDPSERFAAAVVVLSLTTTLLAVLMVPLDVYAVSHGALDLRRAPRCARLDRVRPRPRRRAARALARRGAVRLLLRRGGRGRLRPRALGAPEGGERALRCTLVAGGARAALLFAGLLVLRPEERPTRAGIKGPTAPWVRQLLDLEHGGLSVLNFAVAALGAAGAAAPLLPPRTAS